MRTQALFFFFPLIPPTSVIEYAPKMFERYGCCCPEKQEANNCKSVGVIDCALTWRADVQAGIEKQWRRGRLQAQLPPLGLVLMTLGWVGQQRVQSSSGPVCSLLRGSAPNMKSHKAQGCLCLGLFSGLCLL